MAYSKAPMRAPLVAAALMLAAITSASADEISFKDHNGHPMILKESPERIATLATLADNMIVSLDGKPERLVGTPSKSKKYLVNGIMGEFFPQVKNISAKVIGDQGQPNIEELIKLNPGVVFNWHYKQKNIDALRAVGLNAVALVYKKQGMPEAWLNTLGVIMKQEDRAAEFLAWHKQVSDDLSSKLSDLKEADKPSVLYMTHVNRVGGLKSHLQFYIEKAGGRNAANLDQTFAEIDPELLLKWDPDVIWLFGFNPKFTPESLYNNPVYADLKAVKNNRIYKVPSGGSRWDGPNQEIGLSMEWFARTLHPDRMEGNFRSKIKTAYPMLYGHTPDDEQIDKILRKDMNEKSKHYAAILE